MGSEIEWTDETWNVVTGCTKVSAGCKHCYMYRQYPRLAGMGVPGYADGTPDQVRLWSERLETPRHWRKPRKVFVCSMADLFHEAVPLDFLREVFQVMRECPQHTFQVLTKRHERLWQLADELIWPENVWIGVSVENQRWLETRLAPLVWVPVPVHFLSIEPLLSRVSLRDVGYPMTAGTLQWVIAGGESGPNARPCKPSWVRKVRDDCQHYGIPFFFKQWGGRTPKANGRMLDKKVWSGFPHSIWSGLDVEVKALPNKNLQITMDRRRGGG